MHITGRRKTLKGAQTFAKKNLIQWYDDYTQEMTQNYNEIIEAQHDLKNNKKMDLESILTSQITDKLNSLTSQSNDFKKENEKLHNELEE